MARVLIIEPDAFLGGAVAAVLEGKGHEVHLCGLDVVLGEVVESWRPDLALIHKHESAIGERALDLGRRFRALSDAPMMFLMESESLEERIDGFNLGADDVLSRPIAIGEVCARANALLRRTGRITRNVHAVGELEVDEAAHTVSINNRSIDLTAMEFSLLLTLVRHRGQVLSKTQLLSEVWGFDHYDVNLVEVHVSALRRKLERSAPRLIHTVRGAGYVLRPSTRPTLSAPRVTVAS